ncbi:potassium transporter Kup [Eleftheria terrae]|uniref:potassium transporter Kup n=1 Tax=Eleftheria terrae TaxID=1597781 RepID=UPI00263BB44F|nr:potassium transporter Kup [Eleftheria terrae]WKB54399.1 potassium transporter Kup [Eleftheria terrae]
MSDSNTHKNLAALTLGALGVVYGDIGTSPLYALKEIFHAGHVPPTPDNILGVLSLIFWTMTVIVSLKYVLLILRADNNGEGGLIAMLALATTAVKDKPRLREVLLLAGLFGTAVFYGDGVITPAISVLSAVEGLQVVAPPLKSYVLPVTLLVLTGLFVVQRFGTGGIGRFFGPVTLMWFTVLIALGLPHVLSAPGVLKALNPLYALEFFLHFKATAFVALGAVILVVTGGEALYADMGHFGKRPIRLAWYGLVMPALVVNYFGQGALLLQQPTAVDNPFYKMAPDWAGVPLVILATAATVIASQALISAAFSVTKQAIQLGFLPRMQVLHTSASDVGQIYVPFINWGLYVLIVLAVVLFETSTSLASAYGIAVALDMTITTIMTFFVVRYGWRYPLWLAIGATVFFFVIDVAFFASNMLKLFHGGWFPLMIGAAMFALMLTWRDGREILSEKLRTSSTGLKEFLDSVFLGEPVRVPGTAVFLTAEEDIAPNALLHNLKHNQVLHAQNLFVTVRHHQVPVVAPERRLVIESLGRDCWKLVLHFGFKEETDVPQALCQLGQHGVELDEMRTSYFLSRELVLPKFGNAGMAMWREKLFANLHHNASGAADFLCLPPNRVVEVGAQVEI